jgi:hypothetical protein
MTTTEPFVHPGALDVESLEQMTRAVEKSAPAKVLEGDMLRELTKKVHRPDIVLPVPDRPGWAVRYSVMLNTEEQEIWLKAATDKQAKTVNMFRLSLLTLAGQCTGILRDGELVELDGGPLTFSSKALADMYQSIDPGVTVREFYGNDVVVGSVYSALVEAAGVGDRLGPTNASSS